MKYLLLILALLGVIVSSLALREHYRMYGDPHAASMSVGTAASSITAGMR